MAHPYEVARDNTGLTFRMAPHRERERAIIRDIDLFKKPQAVSCAHCGNPEGFRLLADAAEDSGLLMVGCKCGVWYRAMEIKVPQMNNDRAARLGLWVPNNHRMVEVEVDFSA